MYKTAKYLKKQSRYILELKKYNKQKIGNDEIWQIASVDHFHIFNEIISFEIRKYLQEQELRKGNRNE